MSVEPIYIPRRITRDFILLHPNLTFIHSRSVHKSISAGQHAVCWNLPNCFGIPVRNSMCKSSGYFNDNDFLNATIEIDVAINYVILDNPIIPFQKIGEGNSNLRYMCPRIYAYLMKAIDSIKYPNIIYET